MPFISRTELDALRSNVARAQGESATLRAEAEFLRQLALDAGKDLKAERTANNKMILSLTDRKLQSHGQAPITPKPPKDDDKPKKLSALEEAELASWCDDFEGRFNHTQVRQMYDQYRTTGQLPAVSEEAIG